MLIGKPEELDKTSCVCPVIRAFIILTNDAMPEDLLQEQYGDLPWVILGSRTDDLEVELKRAYHFADVAARVITPLALNGVGLPQEAEKLRSVAKIVDKNAAYAASCATYAAADAAAHAVAHSAAYAAADAAAHSADAAASQAADAAAYAAYAAYAASQAALAAAYAADAADVDVWAACRQAIIDACKIGDNRPVEAVLSREQLREALNK
jgi:hypothetical protein